ncbi:type II toxin-antitoxin system PemK/MazF family toxin [Streptosporangiaceae bacterium NEAU-GS5]|nr:type II toxin-antitoxin system PemK/MazF family toxin [Streptosporangiaceae bacterium NEAU-GS5]
MSGQVGMNGIMPWWDGNKREPVDPILDPEWVNTLRRGDVVYVFLHGRVGRERNCDGYLNGRPAAVVRNDKLNRWRPQLIVATLTDVSAYRGLRTQVRVDKKELGEGGKDSIIDCEDILTIDTCRINVTKGLWARLSTATMRRVNVGLGESFGLRLAS